MNQSEEQYEKEYFMHLESERLKSFNNWPFDDACECVPEKMAAAGFYHCPTDQEPDAVCCFMCYKELDGWEPDDDPWKEHLKHSPQCPFLKLEGPLESLSVERVMLLEMTRQKNKLKKIYEVKINELKEHAKHVREEMEHLM
ncbi:hypothetical protein ScPMuIL_004755 [Solemya velum]